MRPLAIAIVLACLGCGQHHAGGGGGGGGDGPSPPDSPPAGVTHYIYVVGQNGSIDVYDLDNAFAHVKTVAVAQLAGTGERLGAVASSVTGKLYISSGQQTTGPGHVLAFDVATDSVTWAKTFNSFDVDSAALSTDGATLFQATGALATGGTWEVLDTATGTVTGTIDSGGTGPHDTIVTLDGTKVLLGPRHSNYIVVVDIATKNILQHVGPAASGIRPFTIDGKATRVFFNTGGLNGFYVGDLTTGQILYTVQPAGFTNVGACGGSHGVSLSPDETELYLADCTNNYVHVFDVTGLPGTAPVGVADIHLPTTMTNEGWLSHSRDGRYVFVGACGDVVDTRTRTIVGNLGALNATMIWTEIDLANGAIAFSPLSRNQGGYLH